MLLLAHSRRHNRDILCGTLQHQQGQSRDSAAGKYWGLVLRITLQTLVKLSKIIHFIFPLIFFVLLMQINKTRQCLLPEQFRRHQYSYLILKLSTRFSELDQKTLSRAEEIIFCMLNNSSLLPTFVSRGQNSGNTQSTVFAKNIYTHMSVQQ